MPRPGWRKLLARYRGMGPSQAFDHLMLETVGKHPATIAMREGEYIDADYRDEFAHFYAQTFRPVPDRCERLHFWRDGDHGKPASYLGFTVLRPIIGRPVCRTLLAPPRELASRISCLAAGAATPFGYRWWVRCFPFISQDSQYGTCAHAAIWMIALYFHLRFRRPRYYLSDLARAASAHQDLLPAVPSEGLTPRQISGVLHDLGMPPIIYRMDRELPPGEDVESIAVRYLNSSLPVMLLSGPDDFHRGHASVLIGYGSDGEGLYFIHHDDQRGPYLTSRSLPSGSPGEDSSEQGGPEHHEAAVTERAAEGEAGAAKPSDEMKPRWRALVVPLPGRIYMGGEVAERTAKFIFEEVLDGRIREEIERAEDEFPDLLPNLDEIYQEWRADELRLRSYVREIGEYKRALRTRGLPDDVVRWHVNISGSHWVWITELQRRTAAAVGPECVIGEVAIDATSDEEWSNALFVNVPGLVIRFPALGDEVEWKGSSQSPATPYRSGCALHA